MASRTVRVFEPYEARAVEFEAVSLVAVLDAIYDTRWREQEELLFTCRDGYQPTLPVDHVLAHRGWIAFDRRDAPAFSIQKLESGRRQEVSLAPFYLIWENLGDEALRAAGDYGWPYQLVGIDLIRSRDRFPHMTPPDDAPEGVRAGFRAFRMHCSRCHTVNGEGGRIGPELNDPVNPLEVRDREWLRRWIDDPAQLLPTARMPRLNPALPERSRAIDEILAYLGAMAARKRGAAEVSSGP